MSDNAFWCTMVLGIIGLVISAIVAGMAIDAYRDCQYIKAGYTRKTLQGHDWPQWVKEEPASQTPPAVYDIATPIAVPLCGKMETAK